VTTLDDARALFPAGTGYLAACTGGLPPRPMLDALRADLDGWEAGVVSAAGYGAIADETRALFAAIAGVPRSWVAIGSQTSAQVAVIAASVPDGAEVLGVDGDFSSVLMPFAAQAHRGVRLRTVPLASLADAVADDTWLVAYSLVQSATGEVADDDAVLRAAAARGARTLVDLTQAAGILPVDATRYDATVTHAYKWLCSPRGVAFMTLAPSFAAAVRPVQTGWYAGEDVWGSCYGADVTLASDARRFDVSPAWQAFVGARAALALFASLDIAAVWAHARGLGDELCDALGTPRQGRAIVTWQDPTGCDLALLQAAGLTASGRAGRVRVAFHLWNDSRDVAAVAGALRAAPARV
jgi:selenocysteine lyase/cysteine desulfurase